MRQRSEKSGRLLVAVVRAEKPLQKVRIAGAGMLELQNNEPSHINWPAEATTKAIPISAK